MSGNEKLERELESFLNEENSRVAAIYRKLPRQEPDASVDAAVLAMARRAVPPARVSTVQPVRRNWMPALSAAAVIALAAGISYRMGPQMWADRSAPAGAPATREANEVAAQKAAEPREEARAKRTDAGAAAAPPASLPEAPKPAPMPASEQPAARMARLQNSPAAAAGKTESAPSPQAQAFPAQAAAGPAASVNADTGAPVELQSAQSVPATASVARDRALEKQEAPAPAVAASAVTAAPAAPAQAFGGIAVPAPVQEQDALDAKRAKDPNANLYPEHWLANIRKMLREKHHDEALRSLTEFRKRYPDYNLPDDLRDLK
jgi:hypothetical protein